MCMCFIYSKLFVIVLHKSRYSYVYSEEAEDNVTSKKVILERGLTAPTLSCLHQKPEAIELDNFV